ncbi:MAG TPA: hypothetical protein VF159_02995, partial [Gemmatimonadaceae bacterium]
THSQLGALYMCLDAGAPFALDSAQLHLERARDLNREQTGPLVYLGELALMRGDFDGAKREFAAVMKTNAASAPAHFYTGYFAWKSNDLTAARREFTKAVTAPAPVAATSGLTEGDTKHGNAMTATTTRCGQLRALWEHGKASDAEQEMLTRYRKLDQILATARTSMRGRRSAIQ